MSVGLVHTISGGYRSIDDRVDSHGVLVRYEEEEP